MLWGERLHLAAGAGGTSPLCTHPSGHRSENIPSPRRAGKAKGKPEEDRAQDTRSKGQWLLSAAGQPGAQAGKETSQSAGSGSGSPGEGAENDAAQEALQLKATCAFERVT
ncbi:hypothetical protein KIL84_000332 [Mauremys mutica]|uniref:Uncharacterized protein n=1 Tax=Mauremys mutica TaxID=74926 RepID=A0A9D3XG51_9SAUR|nr:hypothetical protein KIL84_000332 [Mauremys mutica]